MNDHTTVFEITRNNFLRLSFLIMATLFVFAARQMAANTPGEGGPITTYELIGFGILILLTTQSVRQGRFRSNTTKLALATLVVLIGMCVEWLNSLHETVARSMEVFADLSVGALWLAGGLLLWIQIKQRPINTLATRLVVLGLIIQAGLASLDVSEDLLAGMQDGFGGVRGVAGQTGGAFVVIFYGLGLAASFFVSPDTASAKPVPIGVWLSTTLFEAEYSLIGARLSIAYHQLSFLIWKLLHAKGTFADFYAWEITRKLDRGRAHRTLGKWRFESDSLFGGVSAHDPVSFAERNPKILKDQLFALGLKPSSTLVDYGCGSLRIGQHFIRYLEKANYRGLDITPRFFRDGLSMLGNDVIAAKAPICKVITPQVLTETGMMRPDYLISIAVLKHVPETSLGDYFDKICSLVTENTTLVISFSESDVERRISGKSWSWSADRIQKLIAERLPAATLSIVFKRPQKSRNGVDLNYCLIAARPGPSGPS